MTTQSSFNGDKKEGVWALKKWEDRLRDYLVPMVPRCIETYHLTLTTILWSLVIIGCGFLTRTNIQWLWLASVMIAFQYITDLLDGAIGRARNTGLVKWGFYMDHFLDYFFLSAILIGYALLLPREYAYLFFFMQAIAGAFMVSSFLSFAATNKFEISHLGLGPTEIRIIFILINTLLIIFGEHYLAIALPYALVFLGFGVCVMVFNVQKKLWQDDMQSKNDKVQLAGGEDRSKLPSNKELRKKLGEATNELPEGTL